MAKSKSNHWYDAFKVFVDEFKVESDRAAVILGAAKLDSLLAQILDRFLLPSTGSTDELLEGDSPISTFSARINTCSRLGIISPAFAKSLHLVRRMRNSFAHDVVGVTLQYGPHADRLKSLLLPLQHLPFFIKFRDNIIGESSPSNNFRACLAMMIGRLESILDGTTPLQAKADNEFILDHWAKEQVERDSPIAVVEGQVTEDEG